MAEIPGQWGVAEWTDPPSGVGDSPSFYNYEETEPPAPTAPDCVQAIPYTVEYKSGWNSFESPYLKIPKKVRTILFTASATQMELGMYYDFDEGVYEEYPFATDVELEAWYWADAEFTDPVGVGTNPSYYSGLAGTPIITSVPGVRGDGEYIKVGLTATIDGFPLSIQEIALYLKQGRMI